MTISTMPDTTARVAAIADRRRARAGLQAAQAADARDQQREHERLDAARHEVLEPDDAFACLHERDERDLERQHRERAAEQPDQVREQRQERDRQHGGDHARHHQELDRVEAHRRERVDLLVDAHRADLGREGGARAAGQQDRGHQRAQLAQHRQRRSGRRRRSPRRTASSAIADWNARIRPSRNEISATIGSAFTPARSQTTPDVAPADRRRMPDRAERAPRSPGPGTRPARACRAACRPSRARSPRARAGAAARGRGRGRAHADRTAAAARRTRASGSRLRTGAVRGWRSRSTSSAMPAPSQ